MNISTIPVVNQTLVRTLVFQKVMTDMVKAGMAEQSIVNCNSARNPKTTKAENMSAAAVWLCSQKTCKPSKQFVGKKTSRFVKESTNQCFYYKVHIPHYNFSDRKGEICSYFMRRKKNTFDQSQHQEKPQQYQGIALQFLLRITFQ